MLFQSKHIKGRGRGKEIGFPTLNLTIPETLVLDEGVYAAWIVIGSKTYRGALHYGSIPTFEEKVPTLEVHLLDITDEDFPDTENKSIEVDIVSYIRDIKRFDDVVSLSEAIARDVEKVRSILR